MPETREVSGQLYARFAQLLPMPLELEITCAPGELVALFGASGSGKTTVVRSIAGLYSPTSALVRCGSTVWSDSARRVHVPPQRRAVGVVFQDYALFPHMTVREQLLAAMDHLAHAARRARIARLIELARLDGFIDRRPGSLSGGQQQRAAIARALARDPQVLLLDEPFASVDRPLREALHRELSTLRHELRIPIVLVTHEIDDVMRLASHLVMLDHGRAVVSGSLGELTAANALAGIADFREPTVALDGVVAANDTAAGLSTVRVGRLELIVPQLKVQTGVQVRLQIAAREVILATRRPDGLSIHNVIATSVTGVDPAAQPGSSLIRLHSAGVPLLAMVTSDAVGRLGITPGREVFALIKAVAIDAFAA